MLLSPGSRTPFLSSGGSAHASPSFPCTPSPDRHPHIAPQLLNAKPENVERESEIVAESGRLGAVTIATNMAGRGTDILLGGNPEFMARLKVGLIPLSPPPHSCCAAVPADPATPSSLPSDALSSLLSPVVPLQPRATDH